jgi:peptidoglycan-associated lipoprotein
MMSTQMRSLLSRGAFSALCVIPLFLLLVVSGCGKNDPVETDPAAGDGTGADIPAETLPDPDFQGDGTGQGDVDSDDLDTGGMAVELEDVFFDFDKFDLDAEDRAVLARNSEALSAAGSANVLIEGHCDERGTVQYNLALGEKRAKQVRDYLVSLGVDMGRIEVVSYGKERPFASGTGESVWSQNRRAHFVLR